MDIGGYLGKILKIDLSNSKVSIEELSQSFIEKWVGGVGFGARYAILL
jgi:aldehyde:ferredoxin oxidoreductase